MSEPITDITPFIQAKSDQINADDLISGPITVRIVGATRGGAEQPVELRLDGRPIWRPCKTTMRILAAAWGPDASKWTGRSATLFRDSAVRFGGSTVGGIRISALSHLDGPMTISLAESKGKKTTHKIAVLKTLNFAESLAELGIDPGDLDEYCRASARKLPAEGSEAYRGGILNALRGEGRATFDAWKASLTTRQPGEDS